MKFVADLHVHTVSSGHAYSTLEEYVERAREIGLEGLAITDHGPAMPGGPHYYHFSNMRMIPQTLRGIRILKGVEANIVNEKGEIDLSEQEIRWGGLEVIMATFHPRVGYDDQGEEKNTEVLIQALKNPLLNVIAHPGNPKYPVNPPAIVAAAKQAGVLIEINSSSFSSRPGSWERCLDFAREVKRQDWKAIIGSDAHISTMLANFDDALKLISEAGLTEEYIVNTSWERLEKYLINR
jgi:putative hydrolase